MPSLAVLQGRKDGRLGLMIIKDAGEEREANVWVALPSESSKEASENRWAPKTSWARV